MSWTLDQVQKFFYEMNDDRKRAQAQWNKEFPPLKEFYVDGEFGQPKVKHGIWKVDGGMMIIPKSKKGYSLDRKIIICDEYIKAIQEISG